MKGFCDCNQGREPCTCMPPPTTEYPSERRKDPVQRFSVAAQLQLMKALAILGWVGFVLVLMGA